MPVRWRQYENLFALTVFLFMAWRQLGVLWLPHDKAGGPPAGISWLSYFVYPFLLAYGIPLVLMILINTWLLPRYLYHRHQIVILTVSAVAGWLIFCSATAGWYFLKFNFPDPGNLRYFGKKAVGTSSIIAIFYILYLAVRERIIQWVNHADARRSLRILICNRITAVFFLYTAVLMFQAIFKPFSSDAIGTFYVFVVLPVIIIVFINLYALLPWQYRHRRPFYPFVWKLMIAPVALSVVSWLIYILLSKNVYFIILPIHSLLLAALATPLSYLLFFQHKEKLVAIQQLSKDLGKTSADLAFLRSQINPHFLFNTLNTLYGTALQENASRTASGVQRLGDMMRFLLHDNHREEIPLSRELEYVQNYIALQQLRIAHSTNINIDIDINPVNPDKLIAPMLLVPFIENAFKHGIRLSVPSFIRIRFSMDENELHLHVANSIHPKQTADNLPEHSGVGLPNVQQRLQLIYPNRHSLVIQSMDKVFDVQLRISLTTS